MNNLPSEILLKIFTHLSASDLVSLTFLCARFNDIVSSTELSHRLTLYFRKLNDNDDEIVKFREYRSLRIGFFKPQLHKKIITEIGGNFTKIEFAFCKLKLDVYRRVLCECPNVKTLYFTKAELSDVSNKVHEQMPALVGVRITLSMSDPRILKALTYCAATSLCMDHKYRHASGNVVDLLQFLLNQSHLKELSLSDFFRTNLFVDNILDRVDFRLTSLSLRNVNLARTDFFKAFVANNHLESLTSLEVQKLEKCDFTNIIGSCKFLMHLKIDGTHALAEIEELPNLETLTVFGQLPLRLNQLIHKFPELRSIEMHYCQLFYDEQEFLNAYGRISRPNELRELKIVDTTITRLRTRTITLLTLKNVKICEDFFASNQLVEELHVENCDFSDEMLADALKQLRELKQLTVVGESFGTKTVDCINNCCAQLRTLRLSNLRRQVDVRSLFSNPRLKIYLN